MEALILGILLWFGALWQEVLSFLPVPETQPPPAIEMASSSATLPESPTIKEELAISEPPPLVASSSGQSQSEPEPPAPPQYSAEFVALLEEEIHAQINIERKQNDLKVLSYDTTLAKIARAHSADMAQNNYFDHKDKEGCDSACRIDAAGYKWRRVGENIFLIQSSIKFSVSDLAAVIVQGWMGSEGHRHNILESGFSHEGLGVYVEGTSVYATELFSKPR
jgi:uncharacterized protein YkwD